MGAEVLTALRAAIVQVAITPAAARAAPVAAPQGGGGAAPQGEAGGAALAPTKAPELTTEAGPHLIYMITVTVTTLTPAQTRRYSLTRT